VGEAEIQLLREGYEAASRGEWDTAFGGVDPDIELKPSDRAPVPDAIRGREAVAAFFRELFGAFEQVEAEPERFFEHGDRIVAFVTVRLRPQGSRAVIENRIAHLWTLEQGVFVRCEVFPVREQALEAAGLPAARS
jgi:ketosteroid isomerase-like protein